MFNPSLPRENMDAQATSTDGRVTLYMDDETHMFVKRCNKKKQRGGLKLTKNIYFFLFPPKAVFEHVYISTPRTHTSNSVQSCVPSPTTTL
jgi:hypothetical protein